MNIYKGSIYYADLGSVIGSEEGGIRPVLIVSNNIGNYYSSIVTIVPITSKKEKGYKNKKFICIPTHVEIKKLDKKSYALCEQIRTISKNRLRGRISEIDIDTKNKIDCALKISLDIAN